MVQVGTKRYRDIQQARANMARVARRMRESVDLLHEARVLVGDHAPESGAKGSPIIFGIESWLQRVDAWEKEARDLMMMQH